MHVTWSGVLLPIVLLWWAISECISSPREARRLRDVLKGGTGNYADAFGKKRRSYQHKMWWQLPIGVAFLVFSVIRGVRGDWDGAVYGVMIGLWALTSGVVGFVCLRILGP